jgi:3-amino-4-hydroxybenzoic acid synthase
MKICWLDIRAAGDLKKAIVEEAVHQRVDGIVTDDLDDLAPLPPTITKVFFPPTGQAHRDPGSADVVILDGKDATSAAAIAEADPGVEIGQFVDVIDSTSLDRACSAAKSSGWTVLSFRDPTKIPLEIVLAAAAGSSGSVITVASDVAEAEIIFGVLEHGSDGVMVAPHDVGDATKLKAIAESGTASLDLCELSVTAVTDVGMGERVCVDTCSHFRQDEGILVGSHSRGMVLACSETHPLPYMPTRPFRVNAGALHSYTLSANERTSYLSELRSGSKVLAVDSTGQTRVVTVGRVKIERRPLLAIDATAPSGEPVNLIVQHDWHVRVVGVGGAVLNTTDFKPGDKVLGYLPEQARHVGYAIDEFCIER